MANFVVGGGLSGLIWCLFHPHWHLVSEEIGGQMSDPWMGPRLLHDNPENRLLLETLGLPEHSGSTTIGYFIDGRVIRHCPQEDRERYFRKSRCLDTSVAVPASAMSDGQSTIHHLKVDWAEMVSRLEKRAKWTIRENVRSLEGRSINGEHPYDNLVWTPALPLLFRSLGEEVPPVFRANGKKFVLVTDFCDFDFGGFDYVYIPGPEFAYHRATRVPGGVCVEYTLPSEDSCPLPSRFSVSRYKWVPGLQLVPLEDRSVLEGLPQEITLLGRFSEWDHRIKIEDVVEKSRRFPG